VGVDESPIESIKAKANIVTERDFKSRFPTKNIPRKDKEEFNRTFLCRRGCDTGSTTYTEEFNWNDLDHNSAEHVENLLEKLKSETVSRKRGRQPGFKLKRKKEDYINEEEEEEYDDVVRTPRKKQKHSTVTTPRKPRTPSKLLTPSHKR
jgi:origin recognition complex subunit 1